MSVSKTSTTPSSALPATAPVSVPAPLSAIHDIVQQVRHLRQVLQDDKARLGCFFGAGCPLGIYKKDGSGSMVLIPAVAQLTKQVAEKLAEKDKSSDPATVHRQSWDQLSQECTSDECKEPTVEDILTELRTFIYRRGRSKFLDMSKEQCVELDKVICGLIAEAMKKDLPDHRCAYTRFAAWLGGIHRMFPVEVFTPNYDLLFEQAFEKHSHPHFDGFVGSREPWFDIASIEHDVVPSRWTRLWKLHGSINWEQVTEGTAANARIRVVRVARAAAVGQVMIYPSHIKYDQSRRMPYLAMLDRLRSFFRGDPGKRRKDADSYDEGAPRLIVCGYSFLDDHINEVILDGLRGNRKAQCFALMYSDLASHPRVVEYASAYANLTVLAQDGAVIGTRKGSYKADPTALAENKPWLDSSDSAGASSSGAHCKSYLSLPINPLTDHRYSKNHFFDFHAAVDDFKKGFFCRLYAV